jgi:hypothetical protein
MAKQHPRIQNIEVEFEFSRLASQYLVDAYAQVLPEIRSTSKPSKPIKSMQTSPQEVQS